MKIAGTQNCCHAFLIHGLGHAHYERAHTSFDSFATELFGLLGWRHTSIPPYWPTAEASYLYYAFSNINQSTERNWLIKLGFSSVKVSTVYNHTISKKELLESYKKFITEKYAPKAEMLAREAEKRAAREAKRATYRKRGEFRAGDKVYAFEPYGLGRLNHWSDGDWKFDARVSSVKEDGTIDINHNGRIYNIRPVVSNGSNRYNIRRRA